MIYNKPIRLILLAFCIFTILTACHHKKPAPPINDWDKIKSWSFKGKMAILDGNESNTARVKWFVSKNNTQAIFKAPLWLGSLEIIESENTAKLISSKKGESNAETAQELISYELGWHFPWDSLQYWLRGHKTNQPIETIQQTKPSFIDSNWNITYTQWTQTPLGLLPKKIKAEKPPYSVKLIIYSWDFE